MERRLGKGLGSLLGGPAPEAPDSTPEAPATDAGPGVQPVDLASIQPNPYQPRREFDPASLDELSASIRNHGVLQPVVLRPREGGGYELVAGERRYRASIQAGLAAIPATIREVNDRDMLELALVENVQRQSLNPIEKGEAYKVMMSALKLTQEQVADKVGLRRASVANHVRLLSLPADAREALVRGLISMGHARALISLEEKAVSKLLGQISREGLSVRQTEGRVRALAASNTDAPVDVEDEEEKAIVPRAPWVNDIESRMREHLGTKVQIKNGEGYRGQIVIDYFNRDDLDRLIERLAPSDPI